MWNLVSCVCRYGCCGVKFITFLELRKDIIRIILMAKVDINGKGIR